MSVYFGGWISKGPSVWSVGSGRRINLRWGDADTLAWDPPEEPGGTVTVYDTLRSDDSGDFDLGAECVESDDGSDTVASDALDPPPGGMACYLVRAENGCPGSSPRISIQVDLHF